MQSNSRLASQIANEAGVEVNEARTAAYLLDLARDGKTLDEAACLLRQERADARAIARNWGIEFSDYRHGTPRPLVWRKVKRGRWELMDEGRVLAEAVTEEFSPGKRGYRARLVDAPPLEREGSNAEVALKRISLEIERRALPLLGVDDVEIVADFPDGRQHLAPKLPDNPDTMRQALAA